MPGKLTGLFHEMGVPLLCTAVRAQYTRNRSVLRYFVGLVFAENYPVAAHRYTVPSNWKRAVLDHEGLCRHGAVSIIFQA